MEKYHIITFGCQANVADSERIASVLETAGYKKTQSFEKADVLILNTCSVRQSAEDRIFGLNKKLKELKNKNSKLKIILTGCMTHYDQSVLKKRLPYIDIFLPINNLASLPEKLNKKNKISPADYLSFKPRYESKFRAYVPISVGCNNFCTYCIVPYSRGREYSRPAKEIIKEVKNLARKGYKEIWLLGQNVNSYKSEGLNFAKLLRKINSIPGNFWIRFISPHPKDLSDDLIETMAEHKKVAEYINLPLQSGDNEILKKMNRPYTKEYFLDLIHKIRKAIPDIAISTDTIVGFPGETKKQFLNTVDLYRKIKFDMAYISEYSKRPNTAAAKIFKDDVPKKEKARRKKYLTEALTKTALENNKKLVGKIFDILIDEKKKNRFFGRTRGNKIVEISNRIKNPGVGVFKKIKILKAEPWKLKGELL